VPSFSPLNPYCHVAPGYRTRATGAASYTVPKLDVLLSGAFRSEPGTPLAANYIISSAAVTPFLGRAPSNNVTNLTINLLAPGEIFGERVNFLDFRVGKVLRFGREKATISVDLYNAMNTDGILTYNQNFIPGGTWLQPQSYATPRTMKFTLQWDF